MLVDTRLTWPIAFILILSCIFPVIEAFNLLSRVEISVRSIENVQAALLFCFAIFTFTFMRPLQLQNGQKQFWLWAVCWWLLLFGRSTSWGRDYFPEVPKGYFRAISVVLIGAVLFPLLNGELRREIAHKFKTALISVWGVVLAVSGLIISDSIEHERMISAFFLHDQSHRNFVEEIFEFPLIFGLFIVAYGLMTQDKTKSA